MQMALLLRVLCLTPTTTHLPTKHHYHVTPFSSFEFEKKEPYSKTNTNLLFRQPHPSFHPLRLSLAHTPSLIRTKEASSNFTLRLASTSQEQSLKTEAATEEEEEYSQTRLLAQNVPWTSTPEDIRSLFERHGKVLEVELSMYNKTRNRGLAFVEMGSPEEALAALNSLESVCKLHNREFDGRVINLKYARPKKKTPPPALQRKPLTFNLFVANLSYEARSKDLKEFFDSGTGRVVSAEVIFHDNPRRSSGYGFVSFKSKKEADAALSEFQGKSFMGRAIRVAPSKRFVQPGEKSAGSEDTSSESSVNEAEANKAD